MGVEALLALQDVGRHRAQAPLGRRAGRSSTSWTS
jgi:hypothetical protein